MVAPRGNTKLETLFDTPSSSWAQLMVTGKVPELLVVVKATGVETKTNIDEMIAVIRNAGKTPVMRDSQYRVVRKYP